MREGREGRVLWDAGRERGGSGDWLADGGVRGCFGGGRWLRVIESKV